MSAVATDYRYLMLRRYAADFDACRYATMPPLLYALTPPRR